MSELTNIPSQQQEWPGIEAALDPKPDHGEQSWTPRARLAGKKAALSFSCSSNRIRRFASRNSTASAAAALGDFSPSATSARCSQFRRHDSEIPKSLAI